MPFNIPILLTWLRVAMSPLVVGVFYLPDAAEWQAVVTRCKRAGYEPVPAFNPYWERLGVTFEDPDGYRVVLQRDAWES